MKKGGASLAFPENEAYVFRKYFWRNAMSDCKHTPQDQLPHDLSGGHSHAHPGGRRCCGRLLSEKCSPQEEAEKTNQATGEKSCCKGHHKH